MSFPISSAAITRSCLVGALAAALSHAPQAQANDGLILYVAGDVTAQRGERVVNLRRGVKVRAGDTIRTGVAGRTHIRMRDRTLISLRPDTEFGITTYEYDGPKVAAGIAPATVARSSAQASSTGRNGRSAYSLLRGGFRTITGLIGKVDRGAFSVQTPVATIGIRGTTFTAVCLAECSSGLIFGVSEGAIQASNEAGALVLADNEFGYVASTQDPPQMLADRPPQLDDGIAMGGDVEDSDGADMDDAATPGGSGSDDGDTASAAPDETVTVENEFTGRTGRVVVLSAAGQFPHPGVPPIVAGNVPPEEVSTAGNDLRGSLIIGLSAQDSEPARAVPLRFGSQPGAELVSVNGGFDPVSGISWGRYETGGLRISEGSQNFDASAESVGAHWALGPVSNIEVALPTTGTASFPLTGNTDPTSGSGARGFLGDATLEANFTTQTVASTVSLAIDDTVWQASGSGQFGAAFGPDFANNLFAGTYDQVSVGGEGGGNGQFSGLVAGEGNDLFGAALGYQLGGPGGGNVAGVAIFGKPEGP